MLLKSVLGVLGITRIKVKRKFTSLIISWWLEIEHGWFVMIHVPHKRDNIPDPQKKIIDFSIPFHSSLSITRQPIPRCPKEPCRQAQGIIAIQHIELQCSLRQLQSLRYLGSHVRCRFQVLRPSWFLAIWPASRLHLVTQTISKHPNFEFGDVFKFQFKWLLMITSQSDLQNLEFWGKILAIFCHKHPKNYQKNERFPLNKIRNTCSNTCNTFTS